MEHNSDRDIRRLLQSTSAAMTPDEALCAGPGALMGVSTAVEAALMTIPYGNNIRMYYSPGGYAIVMIHVLS
jgi:hypothetical protein